MDVTWQPSTEIVRLSRLCMITKSAADTATEIETNTDITETHKAEIHFPTLFTLIQENDISKFKDCTTKVLPNLVILFLQRYKINKWNSVEIVEQAHKLNSIFVNKYNVSLYDIFIRSEEQVFNAQEVFDNTMMELNRKVLSKDLLRKYPAMVTAYFSILERLEEYGVEIKPIYVCPITVLLIDDFELVHKSNGLKCLWILMQFMSEKHFDDGNYYEVIFESLKRALHEKNIEVTKETLTGLLKFLDQIVPHDVKVTKRDEIFGIILEMVYMETNLRRKKEFFVFLKGFVEAHSVNCVSRKMFKTVLCDVIHVCCNDAVADVLLFDVLECLQAWVRHCWCTWKLSTDNDIISALIKLLYVNRKEKIVTYIQYIIITLINLCTKEERAFIKNNLEQCQITTPEFREKLDEIILDIGNM